MDTRVILSGLYRYLLLTLQLNFRSKQALVYGYLMPVFFLLAFASVFRSDTPLLVPEMGQILTITILGGACIGLPTAMVAERERGVWRRYRLLPVGTGTLVAGTLAVRIVIVAGAVVLQIGLARLIYGTPFPQHPVQAAGAFLVVTASFLGLGLLVAALADDVPAVQALGQCLFLTMILIGGVGVPLAALPVWAQRIAGFMPGRYAVDALQRCFNDSRGLAGAGFSLAALAVIGTAAGVVGAGLLRWDAGRRLGRAGRLGIAAALSSWVAVGAAAALTGRLQPTLPYDTAYEDITDGQIADISYADLPGDNELVTRLAPPFKDGRAPAGMAEFTYRLRDWPPGRLDDPGQSIRNLLSVASIADLRADPREAEMARVVFNELQRRYTPDQLRHVLAWIILRPDDGTVIGYAPELGLPLHAPTRLVRVRCALYAQKYLGRLLGKIRD